jgi:hypothetical protein
MPKNVDKKNQIFPEHFQLYVGTGMRAVCIFCTSCKNQKNSWGYPSNLNGRRTTDGRVTVIGHSHRS